MPEKRRAVSVYLTEAERAQLERAARAQQRSVSFLARVLVLAGLKRARRRIPTPPQQDGESAKA